MSTITFRDEKSVSICAKSSRKLVCNESISSSASEVVIKNLVAHDLDTRPINATGSIARPFTEARVQPIYNGIKLDDKTVTTEALLRFCALPKLEIDRRADLVPYRSSDRTEDA